MPVRFAPPVRPAGPAVCGAGAACGAAGAGELAGPLRLLGRRGGWAAGACGAGAACGAAGAGAACGCRGGAGRGAGPCCPGPGRAGCAGRAGGRFRWSASAGSRRKSSTRPGPQSQGRPDTAGTALRRATRWRRSPHRGHVRCHDAAGRLAGAKTRVLVMLQVRAPSHYPVVTQKTRQTSALKTLFRNYLSMVWPVSPRLPGAIRDRAWKLARRLVTVCGLGHFRPDVTWPRAAAWAKVPAPAEAGR